MEQCEIVIKNYRCFVDSEPCRIILGGEFVALVGPNNSGKSSFLKLFRELRIVWRNLSDIHNMIGGVNGGRFGANAEVVLDQSEIFCDLNDRPLSLCIRLLREGTSEDVTEVEISSERTNPNTWQFRCRRHYDNEFLNAAGNQQWGVTSNFVALHATQRADFSRIISVFDAFNSAFYIGPFRNALNIGTASPYYDIDIGEAFISTWNDWKTGANKVANKAITRVTEDIRKIFGFKQLDIAASIPLKTLSLTIDDKPYKLAETGAGLAQFILVFGNAVIKKPTMILIDEPELNLHPSLQIDFLTSLGSYARESVVFATHAIGLARSVGDHIYSCMRLDGVSRVRAFEQTPSYAEFLGEMGYSTFRELGAETVLLVEGTTDIKTMQQLLRMCGKDHQIVVLSLGGSSLARGNVELELAEIKRICSNVAALVDSERSSEDSSPSKERSEFSQLCEKLGFKVLVTARRATENYFSDAAVKSVLGHKYTALAPFESLKDAALGWDKAVNWKIARAMTWAEIENTDVGKFISTL